MKMHNKKRTLNFTFSRRSIKTWMKTCLFFKLINWLINFWLHWVFVAAHGLSLVAASGVYSSLWCAGFSLRWLLLLRSMGSRRAGFSSCGMWAQYLWCTGLVTPRHVGSSGTRRSWTRDQTRVSCIGRQILHHCTTREVLENLLKMEESMAAVRTLLAALQVHGLTEESSSCWAVTSIPVGGYATHRLLPWDLRHTHPWRQGISLTDTSAWGLPSDFPSLLRLCGGLRYFHPPYLLLPFVPGQTCIVLDDSPSLLWLPPHILSQAFPS